MKFHSNIRTITFSCISKFKCFCWTIFNQPVHYEILVNGCPNFSHCTCDIHEELKLVILCDILWPHPHALNSAPCLKCHKINTLNTWYYILFFSECPATLSNISLLERGYPFLKWFAQIRNWLSQENIKILFLPATL